MKGLFAYVLPKVVKSVGGVVVGLFVFGVFKSVYERFYPKLEASLSGFSSISGMASSNVVLTDAVLQNFRWFDVLNYILPISETINTLSLFVPAIVTVYVVKFVFRILDVWINGVLSIVKGS